MPPNKFKISLPPELEIGLQKLLFQVGQAGAKAAAAGAKSLVSDVRKKVKEIDQRLAHAEKVARERSGNDDER